MTTAPKKPTRQIVGEMTRDGFTPRQIATGLGISTQAVYQHLHRLELQPAKRGPK